MRRGKITIPALKNGYGCGLSHTWTKLTVFSFCKLKTCKNVDSILNLIYFKKTELVSVKTAVVFSPF